MRECRRVARWSGRRARRALHAALLACASAMLLSACNLGPYYHKPDIRPADNWATQPPAPATDWPTSDWWHGFNSAELDALIGEAQTANDDLRAAVARVHQADAQRRIAGAPLLPSVDLDGTATRGRQPVQGAGYVTGNDFNPLLSASYELDFWGKNRATYQQANYLAKASRFDRTTVELSVLSGVAGSYFQALELRDRLAIAHDNFTNAS